MSLISGQNPRSIRSGGAASTGQKQAAKAG